MLSLTIAIVSRQAFCVVEEWIEGSASGVSKFRASKSAQYPFRVRVLFMGWAIDQGEGMERFLEDHQKRRLTERFDILTAINILKSQGYHDDEVIREITRVFYVDLDAYQEVLEQARAA